MARLFEEGVLPPAWRGCAEVAWAPADEAEGEGDEQAEAAGGGQPSAAWLRTFWKFAHETGADLGCFAEWPLLPCSGGVLRRLSEQTSVIDMAVADDQLRACLARVGCRELDLATVGAAPAEALTRSYVRPCTADGVLAALATVESSGGSVVQLVSDLQPAERRVLRSFVSGQYMNGWRATADQSKFLCSLPVYESYGVGESETNFVDLVVQRWIPPQGAPKDLLSQRCLKLVQGEDASVYECLGVGQGTEADFYKEYVFPHRLGELDHATHHIVVLNLLRDLPRFVEAEPDFVQFLSRLPFVETVSGKMKSPPELYHPTLRESLAKLIDVDDYIPLSIYCEEPTVLDACVQAGVRTKFGRHTLIDSAKSLAVLPTAESAARSKALLAYLDENYFHVMTTQDAADTDIHSFKAQLHELCWVPVLYEPPYTFLPWPAQKACVAKVADLSTQDNMWFTSYSLRVLDADVQTPELLNALNASRPASLQQLTTQLVQLSAAHDAITAEADGAIFAEHMSGVAEAIYERLGEFCFNETLAEQAELEACCVRLAPTKWFWQAAAAGPGELARGRFLPSRAVAFSAAADASPYLCTVEG
jgi:hypothetical protein